MSAAVDFSTLLEQAQGLGPSDVGQRLTRLLADVVAAGFTEAETAHVLKAAAEATGTPVESIKADYRGVRGRPVAANHDPRANVVTMPGTFKLTDTGNAERLVARHGGAIRYCHPMGKWLYWDGARWARDEGGQISRFAKETVRSIYAEAAGVPDQAARASIADHAKRSESDNARKAMARLAQDEPGIPISPEEMDVDPWALNVANGTIDLRKGELREHRPEEHHTKLAPVTFDPAAACPTFDAYLLRTMGGRSELVDYLRRACGYALTGDTREQCIFINHGTGANGKTTLIEVIRRILGDYAVQADFSSFAARNNSAVRNDLARLKGARFVSAVELEGGQRLSESIVKQISGGDAITARYLFAEYFDFVPQFKLFLAANHKPIIRGADHAIWRRIHLVPFDVTIPPEERDKNLLAKLMAEAPGILAWMVRGCLEWQSIGLQPPGAVSKATAEYREEMDTLGDFLDEVCVLDPAAEAATADIYRAYLAWAETSSEQPMSKKALGLRLGERGLRPGKVGQRRSRGWLGIRLRTDADASGAADAFGRVFLESQLHMYAREEYQENASQCVRDENASAGEQEVFDL